jgi:CheY-like chemotaxis protein
MLPNKPPAEFAQALACQAERMEIVGQLTGGVVHDFNNILTVITGTIEILAEAVEDQPDLAAIAALIAEAAARGANLTSHLLAFARGQPSQPCDVDVNALLIDAARLLRPTLGEQIEIDTALAPDVSFALVDPSQLMTAILKLAIMARDAMPEGGKLRFETATAAPEGHAGADGEIIAATEILITINVRREGVSDARPDPVLAGLGMIQDFIAQSHGHVEVCSGAGQGLSVRIFLPRATGLAPSPAQGPGEGGDEAILIVEDDALVRKYVIGQVQSLGYRVLAAGNAGEALAIIDGAEKIDLLFTDIVMPGSINGRQLAVEALNRRPLLKILYTSGYSKNIVVHDGRLDAGVLLLAKPYRKADLARMIRTALAA